jgi:toxin CptA
MRLPPSVHVVLGPSRIVGAVIGLAGLATIVIVFLLPVDGGLQALGVLAVLAWVAAVFWVVALRRSRFAITELRLAADLVLVVHMGDGRLVAGHVRSSTYVGAWVTTIVWRADRARWSRTVLIVADMLPAEDFRRLRVMLRYARSAVEEGVPASQA